MTREEKQEAGTARAQKTIETIKTRDYIANVADYRVIGNPNGGKYASERKISLLDAKGKKISEIRCGYTSIEDEAFFSEMLKFVKTLKK